MKSNFDSQEKNPINLKSMIFFVMKLFNEIVDV